MVVSLDAQLQVQVEEKVRAGQRASLEPGPASAEGRAPGEHGEELRAPLSPHRRGLRRPATGVSSPPWPSSPGREHELQRKAPRPQTGTVLTAQITDASAPTGLDAGKVTRKVCCRANAA